jgi:hypothetical protein
MVQCRSLSGGTRPTPWRAWPTLLIAMILTASLSALLWQLLRDAVNRWG